MVRCALGPNGPIVSRTAPGRGAWVCSADCVRAAIAKKAFDRAWRQSVPAGWVDALRIAFEGVITEVEQLPAVPGKAPGRSVTTKG